MHRLFVGLRPPPEIRRELMALMGGVPGARWQSDEQLHVTLRFIGEVDRQVAEDIADALGHVVAPAIEARLGGVGRFEDRGRTHALWAGVEPRTPLTALHRKLDQALVRIGLPPERRAYLPHITLARFSRSGGGGAAIDAFLARHAGLTSASFALDHIHLFESHLARDGARYETVARWPLDAAASGAGIA